MRRSRAVVFSLALSGALLARASLPAQTVGIIKGRVTGPTGEGLTGASVSVTGTQRAAVVRSDGSYQLTLPEGRYEIRVRLIGYGTAADSVTVSGSSVTKDFRIERISTTLETVAILGTRRDQRTVISAPVPIDVLSAADLIRSGRTETAQMLQSVAPSINFPRATVADGTDHIRPARCAVSRPTRH